MAYLHHNAISEQDWQNLSAEYGEVVSRTVLRTDEFMAAYPRETDRVEFKEGVGDAVKRAMVAFMNTHGGDIFIGIDDTGRVVGVRDAGATVDKVHVAIQDIRDAGRYEVLLLQVGTKPVVRVSVHPRIHGIAQLTNGAVLVRRGEQNVPVFGSELVSLVLDRQMQRYEAQPVRATLADVDSGMLDDLVDIHGWHPDGDDIRARLEERLLVDRGTGRLTVAGALFLAPDDIALGKSYLDVRRYPDDGDVYDQRRQFAGPLHHQVRDATRDVLRELGTEFVVSGTHRYEMPRLPHVVVREAIANAVAHRSYELTGTATVVEIRPARVVVRSPGRLPEGVTVANLRYANSARNQAVLDVLRRFRVAEDAGRGVDVMQDTMAEALLDPPRFVEHDSAFEVILPVHSPITLEERAWALELERTGRVAKSDLLLLVRAARGARLTNAVARAALGVDSVEARNALRRLCDAGLLRQDGTRGGATYLLADTVRPFVATRLSTEQLADMVVRHAERAPLTNRIVREITGLDRPDALALLNRLVRDRRLTREGAKRGTRYVLP